MTVSAGWHSTVRSGNAHTRRDQEQHHDPLQTEAVDHVLPGGAHRITITAFGGDLPATAAFHRVVGSQHHGYSWGHQAGDEQPQEDAAGLTRRPRRPVQDAMIVGEVALATQPHHP
jgi:hypothetical protein